jgi:hypothetical protein
MDTLPRQNDPDNTLLKKILAATNSAGAGGIGYTPENVANKSTDVNLGNSDTLYPSQLAVKTFALAVESNAHAYTDELTINHSTLTQASPTVIDFTSDPYRTCTLSGDVTFSTTNRSAARSVTIKIIAGASSRNFTFPTDWVFVGAAAPASLAANKVGILTVTCFGTADTDVIAAYAAQP